MFRQTFFLFEASPLKQKLFASDKKLAVGLKVS